MSDGVSALLRSLWAPLVMALLGGFASNWAMTQDVRVQLAEIKGEIKALRDVYEIRVGNLEREANKGDRFTAAQGDGLAKRLDRLEVKLFGQGGQ